MLTFVISGPLREIADNRSEVRVDGTPSSLGEGLELLWTEWPAFRDRVVTEVGELRPHLNVFVDGEDVRYSGGFHTPLRDGAEIVILPAVSGG